MAHLGRIFPIIQKSCHNHKIPFANDPIVNLIIMLINDNYKIEFIL
jgi:hypothetical protein